MGKPLSAVWEIRGPVKEDIMQNKIPSTCVGQPNNRCVHRWWKWLRLALLAPCHFQHLSKSSKMSKWRASISHRVISFREPLFRA